MSARPALPLCLSLFAAGLCSAGCDDSLKSVSSIEETRVLGARVEVEADPNRSSPQPGEAASLSFFVAAPSAAPQISYSLSLCAAQLTNTGFPPCASAPFASTVQAEPANAAARLDFRVPEDVALESTPHAFASGLICPDSSLNLGADGAWSCDWGSGTRVAFEFDLGGPQHSNLSPSFGVNALLLDGEPWPPSSAASCDSGSLPQVVTKTRHALRIDLEDSSFELLTRETSLDPGRETLLVSPFVDAGQLDHGFLSLSADTPSEQRRVSWDAPALQGAEPRLVHFYFVVRDARGGQDFTNRALCVVP
ncbi:MAG TPA: hypothetical protein VER04_14725 [Polyangiaceae bacterium]|nr:hypothetical protein [Polyangiaceae bacterium]